jgi:biotin transport system substrate-specific component
VVVIGLLTARILPRYPLWQGILVNLVGGVLVVYLCGVTWLGIRTTFAAAITGSFVFLPGDILKSVVAALVIKQVHRSIPGLIEGVSSANPPAPPAQKVSS